MCWISQWTEWVLSLILMGLILYLINIFFLTRQKLVSFQALNLNLKTLASSSETSRRIIFDLYPDKCPSVLQDRARIALYSSHRNRTNCFGILIISKHRFLRLWTHWIPSYILKNIWFPTFSIWITPLITLVFVSETES